MISVAAIIVFFAQLLFVFNYFVSIWRGKKVEGDKPNPWGSTTLEWTTNVDPGHGNWEGEIPEVHRWAYDFKPNEVDGTDFVMQTEPLREGEEAH